METIVAIGPRRFKPYPEYKDSGVEWLGELPAHWDVAPVYARYEVALGKMLDAKRVTGNPFGPYLRNVDVQWDRVNVEDLPRMDFAMAERERYGLRPGDLLVCEGGEVGRTALWRGELAECFYQKAIHRVRPSTNRDEPRYFFYVMRSASERGVFVAGGNPNTIDHLTADQLRHHRFTFPPRREQREIASFLDRETAKIDAMVAKKERVIELLQEKRIALITRAVTKGLDPNVPTKDSGVEWLGEIPTHWDVAPVYARYEIALGKMLDAKRVTGNPFGPYLRNVDVQWDRVNVEDLPQMDFAMAERERYGLRSGDLLVCEGGEVGRTAIWRGELAECFYQKAIHRVRPSTNRDEPRYFFYVMFSASNRGVFVAGGNPNTIDHLTAVQLRHHRFTFPPLREQREIASFLDRETANINTLMAKVSDGIDRLKECRAALISAAVTGKIDVRTT